MKKVLVKLILGFAIIILLGTPKSIFAADPPGTCTLQLNPGEPNTSYTDTEANCHKTVDSSSGTIKFISWKAVSSTTDTTPQTGQPNNAAYNLLAPLPCDSSTSGCTTNDNGANTLSNYDTSKGLGDYLNLMLRIFIGLCAVLAVIMIVLGGLEYMGTELIAHKEEGKHRITNAIFGLLLALGAWLILNQINPSILNTDIKFPDATVSIDIGGEGSSSFQPLNSTALSSLGITCNNNGGSSQLASIAGSFAGHTNYSEASRNTINGSIVNLDCSSFVGQVYTCAGLGNPGSTTSEIFSPGNAVAVNNISADGTQFNGQPLQVGDLLGWPPNTAGQASGHVLMYIGNGQVIDQNPGGVTTRALSSYKFLSAIKYVIPVSSSGNH